MTKSYTVKDGDRIWPLIQLIRNTHIDDLTSERLLHLQELVESWRLTDASGKRIDAHD